MEANEIILGKVYRDKITNFVGVAVSRTEFLYSCHRIALQPKELKDGKPIDVQYFDCLQLVEVVEVEEVVIDPIRKSAKAGGPGDCAKPHDCPSR